MAGTLEGGKRAARTNRKKYDKEYQAKYGMTFYQYLGHQGGKAGTTGGFYANRELASIAGRMGGMLSKRKKRFIGYNKKGEAQYQDAA